MATKIVAIQQLTSPTNLEKLRSFVGSVHHLAKFLPNPFQLFRTLRLLITRITIFICTTEHEKHFNQIEDKIAEVTENKHFNPNLETRTNFDASPKSLGSSTNSNYWAQSGRFSILSTKSTASHLSVITDHRAFFTIGGKIEQKNHTIAA